MDQIIFGALGFLIGLALLYGVFRLAISSRTSWMPPPSGRTDQASTDWTGGTDDGLSGSHHGS